LLLRLFVPCFAPLLSLCSFVSLCLLVSFTFLRLSVSFRSVPAIVPLSSSISHSITLLHFILQVRIRELIVQQNLNSTIITRMSSQRGLVNNRVQITPTSTLASLEDFSNLSEQIYRHIANGNSTQPLTTPNRKYGGPGSRHRASIVIRNPEHVDRRGMTPDEMARLNLRVLLRRQALCRLQQRGENISEWLNSTITMVSTVSEAPDESLAEAPISQDPIESGYSSKSIKTAKKPAKARAAKSKKGQDSNSEEGPATKKMKRETPAPQPIASSAKITNIPAVSYFQEI
jgi:hypothetical protein